MFKKAILVLICCLPMVGSAAQTTWGTRLVAQNENSRNQHVSDNEIQSNIQKELQGGWFSAGYPNVTAEVDDGTVTLSGIVENTSDIEAVESRVSGVKGVKLVINNLMAGDSEHDQARGLTDDHIRNRVESELTDRWWGNYPDVQIDVNDGVIVLRGTVESISDVDNIEGRLKDIPGVKVIRSQLRIREEM